MPCFLIGVFCLSEMSLKWYQTDVVEFTAGVTSLGKLRYAVSDSVVV